MASNTRCKTSVWLLGPPISELLQSKLPTKREVLQLFFHYHNEEKKNVTEATSSVVNDVMNVWDRARIATSHRPYIIKSFKKLYDDYLKLKKNKKRVTKTENSRQHTFVSSLMSLFDIAHKNVEKRTSNPEDIEFLSAQREVNRRGYMVGVDKNEEKKQALALKRQADMERRRTRVRLEEEALFEKAVLDSSNDDNSDDESDKSSFSPKRRREECSKRVRGRVDVVDEKVAAALDRTCTSSRNASYILSAAARNLGHRTASDFKLSPSTIHRAREKFRCKISAEIKASFGGHDIPFIVHWDGKMMQDFTGSTPGTVDRLPIAVSGKGIQKLLAVPKLQSATGHMIAEAVVEALEEWSIVDKVKGLSFDTTAANTGCKLGACVRIQQRLNKSLLHLACRHHIHELVLAKAYTVILGEDPKSPKIQLCDEFRAFWSHIDQTQFNSAVDCEATIEVVAPFKDVVLSFAFEQLGIQHPRDDYKELLELAIIFLGGVPPGGANFKRPGAVHRARWMARAIYSLKMWLFRDQFERDTRVTRSSTSRGGCNYQDLQWDKIFQFNVFVVKCYLRSWFQSPVAAAAPANDLQLLQDLCSMSPSNVASAVSSTFGRHLWYLSEIHVALAFFDQTVSIEMKRNMLSAMANHQGSADPKPRITLPEPTGKTIADFVTTSTTNFFTILNLDTTFLQVDPEMWESSPSYLSAADVVCNLKVVNDLAERSVSLIQQFNSSLTRNEEQKQYLLQVVESHRKQFPSKAKKNLPGRSSSTDVE